MFTLQVRPCDSRVGCVNVYVKHTESDILACVRANSPNLGTNSSIPFCECELIELRVRNDRIRDKLIEAVYEKNQLPSSTVSKRTRYW